MCKLKNKRTLASFALLMSSATAVPNQSLPIVDLGYELHQAASLNVSYNPSIGPGQYHRCIR